MSSLVTGEGVVLDLRLARPATRALALGIDLVIQAVAFVGVLILVTRVLIDSSDVFGRGLLIFIAALIFVGYSTAIETLTRGKSVGKYALGLRVVGDDGGPVRFRQSLVRAMTGVFVDFFLTFGIAGFTVAMLHRNGKRVGDLLAGTVVIAERTPSAAAVATGRLPEVPPQLRAWTAAADISRVPEDLALSARSYLSRWHELSPGARDGLGRRLATAVEAYVSPPPPQPVPPRDYLTAVLAERRDRALGRSSPAGPTGPDRHE